MNKIFYSLMFLSCTYTSLSAETTPPYAISYKYPHFDKNPYLTSEKTKKIRPHLIPLDHHLKSALDQIFSEGRVIADANSLAEAGFIEICNRDSYVRVVRHPDLPGVVLKLYLDDETRLKKNIEGWVWFVRRCEGALNIRKLISRKKLTYFTVPDKWIYPLPPHPSSAKNPILLLATDMDLASSEESIRAWKAVSNKKIIDELYNILNHGYASAWLPWNIPYTKSGKFTCIDTEYPKRKLNLSEASNFLSPEMKKYWESIID